MAFESYLVIVTADRAKVLRLGKNYTQVQDLAPESGMSAFSAILPISVSIRCRVNGIVLR